MAESNPSSTVDVNENIMGRLESVSDDTNITLETNEPDDEFEKLLNSFIASEKSDTMDITGQTLNKEEQTAPRQTGDLGTDEVELAQAYQNLIDAVTAISLAYEKQMPELIFDPSRLVPNYKPSLGRKIVQDTLSCWDLMFSAFPEKLSTISPNSTDEQFLNFAEGLSDQNLQLAIISYVEILIDIENCEISYEERRLKAQRRRIERALYEEYQRRRERKLKFIKAIPLLIIKTYF